MTNDQEPKPKFLRVVRSSRSIDFPRLARENGIDFFGVILPAIKADAEFRTQLEQALVEIKYELLGSILDVARSGKKQYGASPDPATIKAVIGYIDSGVLLGVTEDEPADSGDMSAHLERLGIKRNEE